MGLTLEHLVVLPGQCVGVLDGEVKVGGWTGEKNVWSVCHRIMTQKMTSYVHFKHENSITETEPLGLQIKI